MSGHNKWSKIKHKKAAADAKKSQVFSKLAKLLTTEAKKAKGDASSPGLAAAIAKAKAANMPGDNIERAIKKGSDTESAAMEAITYEAYGPGGSALIIEALTDNRNRASAEIKHILSKYNATLASPGAAVWAFKKVDSKWEPNTPLPLSAEDIDNLRDLIEELEENEDVQEVYTNAAFS
jgi:YebC/PmpR family DNA-binding regulatory protein